RDGEDIGCIRILAAHSLRRHWRTRGRGQRVAGRALGGENRGGAVALVDVAIDCHGRADFAVALQAADGHGYIVDHAETFAVAGKSVMESATDVDGDPVG